MLGRVPLLSAPQVEAPRVRAIKRFLVNTFLHKAVETTGSQCFSGETLHSYSVLSNTAVDRYLSYAQATRATEFDPCLGVSGCGVNSTNVESDCWVECFYRTILQEPKMTVSELVEPWERAFQTGGCPGLPPYVPPRSANASLRNHALSTG